MPWRSLACRAPGALCVVCCVSCVVCRATLPDALSPALSFSLAFTQTCTWSASGSIMLALEQSEHLLLFVAKFFVAISSVGRLHADTDKRECPSCRRGRARKSKPGPAGHNTWLRSMESLPPIWLDGPSIHNTPAPLFIFFAHAFNPPAVSTSCFHAGLLAITRPITFGCE